MRLALLALLLGGALIASASPARAETEVFYGEDLNDTQNPETQADDPVRIPHPNSDAVRDSFLARFLGADTESFESFAGDTAGPLQLQFGPDVATLSGGGRVLDLPTGVFNGVYPTTGNRVWLDLVGANQQVFTVTFSSPQVAFGCYVTDIEVAQLTVRLVHADQGPDSVIPAPATLPAGSGSVAYLGLIDLERPFVSLTFENASGGVDGFGYDDMTIGRPGRVKPPEIETYFLPRRLLYKPDARDAAKSRLSAQGFFDTGRDGVDLTAPATVTVGTRDFAIPGLTLHPSGKRYEYVSDGLVFLVTPNPSGSSRARFTLRATGDFTGAIDPSGEIALRFRNAATEGGCRVKLTRGLYRLAKDRGALLEPNLFLVRARAVVGGAGKDSLRTVVGLETDGTTPSAAGDFALTFGDTFEVAVAGADFTRKGDQFVWRGDVGGASVSVVLDYRREIVTVAASRATLGDVPEGRVGVPVAVQLGDAARAVAVTMVRKGASFRY